MTEPHLDMEKVEEVLARYPEGDAESLIHALQDLQAALSYVPVVGVDAICRHLGVPLAKAFSVATFYKAFSLTPKGDVIIRICTGTACHIRGAQVLVDELVAKLEIAPGGTTEDMKFTLETVNCVGACAMAPVVSIDGNYHGKMQPGALLKAIR
ncbi:MAG: NADH-quinone oxidoreductase subunit NuoE family protein [Planctomycetota bacterium]|jgi:NADH-quinone oxidoreductase subunit E